MEDNPNCLVLISAGLWTPAQNVCHTSSKNWGVYQTHMLQESNHFPNALPKSKPLIYFTAKPPCQVWNRCWIISYLRVVSFHLFLDTNSSALVRTGGWINILKHSLHSKPWQSHPDQNSLDYHHFHFFTRKTYKVENSVFHQTLTTMFLTPCVIYLSYGKPAMLTFNLRVGPANPFPKDFFFLRCVTCHSESLQRAKLNYVLWGLWGYLVVWPVLLLTTQTV